MCDEQGENKYGPDIYHVFGQIYLALMEYLLHVWTQGKKISLYVHVICAKIIMTTCTHPFRQP